MTGTHLGQAAGGGAGADASIVRVRDVTKTFGDVRALDGVSLSFEPGIVYGLLGPNGAGKTTLIRVLATLLPPTSGTVEVAGIDVVRDPTAARARIGLAGQFAAVDEYLTGRENVVMVGRLYGLSGREARQRAGEVLERIGLSDAAGRRVGTYSGGMRRRLDLAATLIGRPQVMFLDEPTTGIDPRNRKDIWELIKDLVGAGTTVLLTTQYLEEADQLADRIGVIDHGRIIIEGTADTLKDTLGGEVLELGTEEDDRATAVAALTELIGTEPAFDEVKGVLRVSARDGAQSVVDAIVALNAAGVKPTGVALHKPTLDDVFLDLTGSDPQAAPAGGARREPKRR